MLLCSMVRPRVTHCPKGHTMTGTNVKWYGRRRICVTCNRLRAYARTKLMPEKVREIVAKMHAEIEASERAAATSFRPK